MYKKLNQTKSPKIDSKATKNFDEIIEMFDLFKKTFFKKEQKYFSKIHKIWEDFYFNKNLLEKQNKENSIVNYHLMHLSKLIFLISQPNLTSFENSF